MAAEVEELGEPAPERVPVLPDIAYRNEITEKCGPVGAFALDTTTLGGVEVPWEGLAVVSGPAGSGRTTAVRSLIDAVADRAAQEGVVLESLLISPMSSSLAGLSIWDGVADSAVERERLT